MSPTQRLRLITITLVALGLSVAVGLVLFALDKNINLFFTPTEISQQAAPVGQKIRVGGMVKTGSFQRHDGLKVHFTLTDYESELDVHYDGILPDLFREGQGIVALGVVNEDGEFVAKEVLAKHDENYMPPEVADTIMKANIGATMKKVSRE